MKFVKDDNGKPRFGLIPPRALLTLAKVLTHGAAKYGDDNWAAGAGWRRYYDALQRHLVAWVDGEDSDPDSGLPHLGHAAACVFFLLEYQIRGLGTDDRIGKKLEVDA